MSSDFKDRFSLDYLISGSNAPSTQTGDKFIPKGTQEAIITYAGKVLAALNRSPNSKACLFDLAKMLSERVDTLSPVLNFLAQNGYVERKEDPVGNDLFALTESGKSAATKL